VSDFWSRLGTWWLGGDMLMPVMLATSLALYTIIGQRAWALFGPSSRRGHRRDELERLMEADHAQREWVGRYVALAEEAELSRGFALIRALTAALPLLGLLGTVAGMVDTFSSLGQGSGGVLRGPSAATIARDASAGIGLALTATQYGMCLAIPAVVCEWLLCRRVDALVQHRDAIARGLVAEHATPLNDEEPEVALEPDYAQVH
jgi:biopolymer transport protein ExbB/TolQ